MASPSSVRPPQVLTDAQARGNRLAATQTSPGWVDVCKIVRDLEKEATDACVEFEGWDSEQIVVLKVRAQAARELREQFFQRIQDAIATATIAAANGATNTEADAQKADELRKSVLSYDTRVPGTY